MNGTRRLLESLLPLQLLGRLHGMGGDRPAAIEFPAAVLFVDVSRFTALVEQLARRGHGGLEEVPKLLSLSYDRCAEQIGALGGEVLYFAGDSLLAYWAAGEDGLGNAVRMAAQCAEAICRGRSKPVDVAPIATEAALHFGIGAGPMRAAIVGGDPVWSLVAGGVAVIDAAKSMTFAHNWEYVLSPAASAVLSDIPRSTLMPSVSAETKDIPIKWLRDFLPPQLQIIFAEAEAESGSPHFDSDRDIGARLDALAEIRPISALLVRITQFTDLGSIPLSSHQALCASLQQIVREHGGPPGEFLFDDKGMIFVAAFGARGTVHRDDPQRAVGAARAINAAVRRADLASSIGIATGEAFFRIVGSNRRRQLMVLGPSVNRAARLMSNAHDDILCDAPTERASRVGFLLERRGTLQLEGLGEMAPVFSPLEPKPPTMPASSPIGRQRELEFLKDAFQEVCAGSNRLVVVLGEPGIGKTTLVNAFSEELRSEGATVAVSRGERDDQRTSLLAWRRMLESLAGLAADGEGGGIFRNIEESVKDHKSVVERLPLLDEVLSIEIRQNEGTRHLAGAHRADATMRLLAEVIGVLARRPLTLVLEDSQWLDSASWRLLEWVLGSLSSLMIILCVRSEEIPEELRNLQRRARNTRADIDADDVTRFLRTVELTDLNETSIRELVTRVLGGAPPQEDIARTVATLAGGNPFFAEEISLTLKSEGLIAERDGFWRSLRPLDGLHYFEGVERLLRERVDRLDAPAQDLIKQAAVIGRSFSRPALETLHGRTVDTSLELLVAAHLVRPIAEREHYEFRHDQIRDVVYSLIPGDVRRRLHGVLADWIEAIRPDVMGIDLAVLVQHFEAAGNNDKAVKYADLAATNALQIGAFREVEAFIGICLEHEPKRQLWDDDQRLRSVRWRRQLAEAHYSRGNIPAQGVAVGLALEAAGKPVPNTRAAIVVRLVGRAFQLTLQQLLPPSDAEDSGPARRWEEELARCLNQAALVDYFELRFTRGMCNLIGAVIHAERTGGLSSEMAVASAQLAGGFGMMGWRKPCSHFMVRAENAAVALADPAIHSHVCNLDALWQIGRCEWPGVDNRLNQAQSLSLKAGDQLRWCNAQGMRFWSLYYRGEQSALEPTALALLSRAQNAGNIQQEIWALRCKALCVLHTDRPREAVEILRLITSASPGVVDLAARISASGALALALARVGQSAESIEWVRETLRLLEHMKRPSSHSIIVGISGAAEVLLRGREAGLSRQYDEWDLWERRALDYLKRYSQVFSVGTAQLGLWTGVSHWLGGRRLQAFAEWRKALTAARNLSLRKDESMIAAEIRRWDDRV